jgi:transcriptional regulator with XRE-family HTH domain
MVYAGKKLPEGVSFKDEQDRFHIAMGGEDDAVQKQIRDAYAELYDEERTIEGVRMVVSKQQQMEHGRGDKPNGQNHAKNRSRDPLAILNVPEIIRYFANTDGQNKDWKEFKQESPEAWQLFLNNRFSDEVMQEFSGTASIIKINRDDTETLDENFPLWKYWLRILRVMNGLSTTQMTEILGMGGNNSYSNIENIVNNGLTLEKAAHLLDKNIFGLPEVTDSDGNTRVDFEYAKRFMGMVGHKNLHLEHLKPQLFASVKAIANAYLRGEITPKEMPPLNELMVLLSHDSLPQVFDNTDTVYKIKSGRFIPHPYLAVSSALYQLDGVDYTPYFAALPYYSKAQNKNIPSPSLSPEQAFELAANTAKTLGICLKIYRESIGKSLKEVGENLGINKRRTHALEIDTKNETLKNKSYEFVLKILAEANPYGLPVDESGKIRADVAEYIREIHIPRRGTRGKISEREIAMIAKAAADKDKWLEFGDVVREIRGINQAFLPISEESNKLGYDPRLRNWREYWNEALQALVEPIQPWQEGTLTIGSTEVRYKIGTDGEYRLHADGLLAIRAALQKNLSIE